METAASPLLDLPEDLVAEASGIPGIQERLVRFVQMEVVMDKHRRERYSPETLAIVERAKARAKRNKEAGEPREVAMKRFLENFEKIDTHLKTT